MATSSQRGSRLYPGRCAKRAHAPAQDFGAQVAAFQLLHGLPVDGQAGPLTLMQLARVAGVDEPRLGVTASPGGR